MFKHGTVWQRPSFLTRKSLCLALLISLSFHIQGVYGCTAPVADDSSASVHSEDQSQIGQQAAAQNVAITQLVSGQPVEREISGWQTQRYQLTAAAGQFVGVNVQQRGVDVSEQLFAPDGKLVAEFNFEVRPQGEEQADFVAETTGRYQLDIKAEVKGATGSYEIRVTGIRAATERERALHEANKLSTQSAIFSGAAEFDKAIQSATRALELSEQQLGPDDVHVGYLLNNIGQLHSRKGNYAQAEQLFQRALAIDKQKLGLANPETALVLEGLGVVYSHTGRFDKAEESLQQAVTVIEQTLGAQHPALTEALRGISALHYLRGDMVRAEQELKRALAIAENTLAPDDFLFTQLLNNLGLVYIAGKDFLRAEPLLQRALEIGERRFGPDAFQLSLALQNLGIIAHEYNKDDQRALELYWRSEKILEKSVGPEHPDTAGLLNNIANIYKSQGDFAKALELHKRAYAIWEKALGPYNGLTLVSVGNVARTYASMGDVANAIKSQIRTDEVIEKNLALNLAIGSERQKIAYFDSLSDRTSRTISLHVNLAPDNSEARDLAALVILQRKGRVLDALSGSLLAFRERLNGEDQKLFDDLNAITARVAKLELSGPGQKPVTEFNKQAAALEGEKEKLETEISRRSAEFRAQTQPVTLTAVQDAVPDGAALVEFAVYRPFNPSVDNLVAYGEPHYIAYVIRHQKDVEWQELGPAKDIDTAIDGFRQALGDPQRRDVQQMARAVDAKVLQPVRALLGDTRQLLISPDGELNLIPFAALVDEQGRYLLERYSFAYLTSGRDLLRLQVHRESKCPPVVVADPAFGPPALISPTSRDGAKDGNSPQTDYSQIFFGPLPGVVEEARALKRLLPRATFLTKEQATKAALKELSGPSILHIATHGFFLQQEQTPKTDNHSGSQTKDGTRLARVVADLDNPLLRSGLALAGANQGGNKNADGILTAFEAAGLDLWGTRLVVLSACDTGVGEVKNGDGVYGLRRAFVLAGAESQVMSLWDVSDHSTRDLIVGYYQSLMQGAGRGEALRQVQLRMLKDKPHSHPYYWASFIQTGEWANLEGRR